MICPEANQKEAGKADKAAAEEEGVNPDHRG